jgi:hypothetical protein
MMGKCPKCGTLITEVGAEEVSVGGRWHGVQYLCPGCLTVLGISVDPVSLKTDTVSEISAHIDEALAPILSVLQQIAARLNRIK